MDEAKFYRQAFEAQKERTDAEISRLKESVMDLHDRWISTLRKLEELERVTGRDALLSSSRLKNAWKAVCDTHDVFRVQFQECDAWEEFQIVKECDELADRLDRLRLEAMMLEGFQSTERLVRSEEELRKKSDDPCDTITHMNARYRKQMDSRRS